jgi:hypothetical protein
MLKLLLDEHLSSDVAAGLRRQDKSITVYSLAHWQDGRFLGLTDDLLLREAAARKLTLVTYDRRTIPPLLKAWGEAGIDHGGVIFVDEKTVPPSDFGGLIRSLRILVRQAGKWDWKNRICYLRR